MGALRRAGVWLGLIEDEQDRDSFYDDEFVDDDDDFAVPTRSRTAHRPTQRRGDRERLDGVGADRTVGDRMARERDLRPDRGDRFDDVRFDDGRLDDARFEGERFERPRPRPAREPRDHHTDLRADLRPDLDEPPVERPRRPPLRLAEPPEREEPPTVRPVARPTAGSTALSVPAQEGLTLAPPVQLRERAAVADDRLARRYEITTLHPTGYSEARAIGEQFRDGHPVIMNLTDLAEADAKRLVDFAAGLAFGLRGSMERVTNRVFLLTPPNVRVSDEDKQRIAEPGFFDQR